MNPTIELSLRNFRCHYNTDIVLEPGITYFYGDSGSGKSTLCKSIEFVLYGGGKHTGITHKDHKKEGTSVTFKYVSVHETFTICRKRPSESIAVEFGNSSGSTRIEGSSAQAWIVNVFGTEESWVSSSYLEQNRLHFFLRESNDKKKELLDQITFGDNSGEKGPEYYQGTLSEKNIQYRRELDRLNHEIKTRSFMIQNIVSQNPDINDYGHFDHETYKSVCDELELLNQEQGKIAIKLEAQEKRKLLVEELQRLINKLPNIEETDRLIDYSENILRLRNVKKSLEGFNPRILDYDESSLDNDRFLFTSFQRGGWNPQDETSERFLERQLELDRSYQEYVRLEREEEELRRQNQEITKTNMAMERAYQEQVRDFERKTQEIFQYRSIKSNVERAFSVLTPPELLDDDDDGTEQYAISKMLYLQNIEKELKCPHCGGGFTVKGDSVHKGHTFTEEQKEFNKTQIYKCEREQQDRKQRRLVTEEYQTFSKMPVPGEPQPVEKYEPIKLHSLSLPSTIPRKPSIKVFEHPKETYDEHLSLVKSQSKIDAYHQCKDFVDDHTVTIDTLNGAKEYRREYDSNLQQIENMKRSLDSIEETNVTTETLQDVIHKINFTRRKAEVGRLVLDINSNQEYIQNLTQVQNNISVIIEQYSMLDKFLTGVANSSIENVISSINNELEIICERLFTVPINILITTTKQLKNGKQKDIANLEISLNGNVYDKPSELSGGETSRVSLALLIAFCSINQSPIFIMDEVLSSIPTELKIIALELIKERANKPFIIHICHEAIEGFHDNIINF